MTQLSKGANAPLTANQVVVTVDLAAPTDLSALLVTESGKVRSDDDFVFYNQPNGPGVRCVPPSAGQGWKIEIDTAAVPADINAVRIVTSLDGGGSFAGHRPVAHVRDQSGADLIDYTVDGLDSEAIVVVIELYRRQGSWKVRAVGQGYAGGLADLIRDHGVSVDDAPASAPTPSAPAAPSAAPPSSPAAAAAPPPPSAPAGAPSAPSYGQAPPPPPAPAFGQPGGAPPAPGVGQSAGPAPSAPSFGQPAAPPQGQPPAAPPQYGQPPAQPPQYGQPPAQPPQFGQPPAQGQPPQYGQPPATAAQHPSAGQPPQGSPQQGSAQQGSAQQGSGEVSLSKSRPVSLTKGQRVTLTKDQGEKLTQIRMGLGWDPIKQGGFFGRREVQIDLDASAVLMAGSDVVDIAFYNHLSSNDGSIQHAGDNRTGAGDGDDEVILVDLTRIPVHVDSVFFIVTSYEGQTFEQVANAFVRLVDHTNNTELARYALAGGMPFTGLVMAKVYRQGSDWKLQAVGEGIHAKYPQEALPHLVRASQGGAYA